MARRIRPVDRLENIVERLDAAVNERDIDELPRAGALSPVDVDVVDKDDEVVVVADLPGFSKGDISIKADSHRLRLEAEHDAKTEVEDDDFYRQERRRESLSRTVPLPVEVDPSEADASYEDGVLSVRLPKSGVKDGEEIDIS